MGFKDDSLFGIDMDMDGDKDRMDDILFMEELDDFDRIHKRGLYAEDEDELDEVIDELESAGLDYDELEDMDEDERREALEDAGLDPDDFDDDF